MDRIRRARASGGAPLRASRARDRAIVESAVDGFVLATAIDADDAPREVVVDGRFRADRNHEREQAQRSVLRAVERVLTDAAAHLARIVGPRACVRQPAVEREQARRTPASAPRRAPRRRESRP